jgi:hypothetical protein
MLSVAHALIASAPTKMGRCGGMTIASAAKKLE